jgi:hypothetical protein
MVLRIFLQTLKLAMATKFMIFILATGVAVYYTRLQILILGNDSGSSENPEMIDVLFI